MRNDEDERYPVTELFGNKWDWEEERLRRIGAGRRQVMDIEEAAYLWETCEAMKLPCHIKFLLDDRGRHPLLSFWCFEDMDSGDNYARFRCAITEIANAFDVEIRLTQRGFGHQWEAQEACKMRVAALSRDIPGLKLVVYEPGYSALNSLMNTHLDEVDSE